MRGSVRSSDWRMAASGSDRHWRSEAARLARGGGIGVRRCLAEESLRVSDRRELDAGGVEISSVKRAASPQAETVMGRGLSAGCVPPWVGAGGSRTRIGEASRRCRGTARGRARPWFKPADSWCGLGASTNCPQSRWRSVARTQRQCRLFRVPAPTRVSVSAAARTARQRSCGHRA